MKSASATVSGAFAASEFNLRIQRQQWRHPIRRWRGIAQVARKRCTVLDLYRPYLACSLFQRIERQAAGLPEQYRSRWSARRCGLRHPGRRHAAQASMRLTSSRGLCDRVFAERRINVGAAGKHCPATA
jgi:hypothetical protein